MIAVENAAFEGMGEQDAKELQRLTWRYVELLREKYEVQLGEEEGEQV